MELDEVAILVSFDLGHLLSYDLNDKEDITRTIKEFGCPGMKEGRKDTEEREEKERWGEYRE